MHTPYLIFAALFVIAVVVVFIATRRQTQEPSARACPPGICAALSSCPDTACPGHPGGACQEQPIKWQAKP